MSASLQELESELDVVGEFDGTDTELPPEVMAALRLETRKKLVVEYQQGRLQMKLLKKVGNDQQAENLEEATTKVLKMIKAIDDGEV